ncbi:hypothetical protein CH063_04522, partial [Colletotrichum higginsianum]
IDAWRRTWRPRRSVVAIFDYGCGRGLQLCLHFDNAVNSMGPALRGEYRVSVSDDDPKIF